MALHWFIVPCIVVEWEQIQRSVSGFGKVSTGVVNQAPAWLQIIVSSQTKVAAVSVKPTGPAFFARPTIAEPKRAVLIFAVLTMSIAVMPLDVCTSAVDVVVMPLGALVKDTFEEVPSRFVNALE
ncbi:hypothetical protein ABD07_11090 [Nitrosomonas oligotropha]|nr:hypothetical protein [Nitrosomonas oligotropha]